MKLPLGIRAWWGTRSQVRALRLAHARELVRTDYVPRFHVSVSVHAGEQAAARYSPEVAAFDVVCDVVAALRDRRKGIESPSGHRAGRGCTLVWTDDADRVYVLRWVKGGWLVVTALPPRGIFGWPVQHGTTAMAQAFARATRRSSLPPPEDVVL